MLHEREMAKTLFEKLWERHVVSESPDAPTVLYIDLHLVHEVTSPQAFAGLRERSLRVRRPERAIATVDHSVPTHDRSLPIADAQAARQIAELGRNCKDFGIELYGLESQYQGIVQRARAANARSLCGVSFHGSTLTTSRTGRAAGAIRSATAASSRPSTGHIRRQRESRKVRRTTRPRKARSESGRKFWSRNVKPGACRVRAAHWNSARSPG